MNSTLAYFICAFWGHSTVYLDWNVIKGKKIQTDNIYPTCKRCGVLTGEPYGVTHLGPFSFELQKNRT